ncbi:D-alanyl-D-alanine carboxypeptidase [Brevibacterium pityocampae]
MNAGEGLTAAEAAGAVPGDGPLAGAGAGAEARARAAVRAHLAEAFAAHPAPEVAWGLVLDGRLVDGENLDRAFRIASMTKSFTAAAVLGIRYGAIPAHRRLDLDDPIAEFVPEASAPIRAITVRDALTMAGGLPTDDPWADRLEAMTAAEFSELVTRSPLRRFAAGTGYEYSNLGYALLGRVIEEVTGRPYTEVVAEEILRPLGLESSGFDVAALPPAAVVPGFRRTADGGLEELVPTRPGAFSAIGGLWSTVPDIAAWIGRLLDASAPVTAAGPAKESGDGAGADPWARALRDIQQPQRFIGIDASAGGPSANSYGCGLHSSTDPVFGEFVHHSGGYPGFGSHMRWHPATRSAVIVFGDITYFPARTIATGAAEACVTALGCDRDPAGRPGAAVSAAAEAGAVTGENVEPAVTAEAEEQRTAAPTGERPTPSSEPLVERLGIELPVAAESRRVAERIERLLRTWDDAEADALFSPNMDLDVPRAERRAVLDAVLAATGEAGAEVGGPEAGGSDSAGSGSGTADAAGDPPAVPDTATQHRHGAGEGASAGVPDVVWRSPTRARWTVHGPDATRTVALELNPFGQVQKLTVEAQGGAAQPALHR